MAYRSLAKLYYGDPHTYAQVFQERFDSEDAVKLDFRIGEKQAFFLQNTEVMKLAYDLLKLDKAVGNLSGLLPGIAKQQYSRKCLIDEIVLTNKIEGVHSSRKEIDEALEVLEKRSNERRKHHRFTGLVNKYAKLMTQETIPLETCRDIRDIYDEVFLKEVIAEEPRNAPDGKLFRKDISAVHSETDRVIHKGLYPESEILNAMEKALAFLNDDSVDKLFRICIFHYLIEYIHPFYDGNGRLGRFILSYCISGTLEPLLAYRLSETIKSNISEYYKAFKVCNDPHNLGDLTPFLLMMLRMISAAMADLKTSLHQRLERWKRYEDLVSSFPDAKNFDTRAMYSYLIQAALFSEKGISTEELKASFQKSYYFVKKILGEIRPELLSANLKDHTKYYQLNLAVLDEILLQGELH